MNWRDFTIFGYGVGVGLAIMPWILWAIVLAQRHQWLWQTPAQIVVEVNLMKHDEIKTIATKLAADIFKTWNEDGWDVDMFRAGLEKALLEIVRQHNEELEAKAQGMRGCAGDFSYSYVKAIREAKP